MLTQLELELVCCIRLTRILLKNKVNLVRLGRVTKRSVLVSLFKGVKALKFLDGPVNAGMRVVKS